MRGEAQSHIDTLKAGKYLTESGLIVRSQDRLFIRKTLEQVMKQEVKLVLIFRASRDGWTPKDFHRLCDD
jgi:hypothetical protein